MKAFLDTSVLIDLLENDQGAISRTEALKPTTSFYTSHINIYEVLRGILSFEGKSRDKMLNSFGTLVLSITVLGVDMESAKAGALVYSELRKSGLPINEPDPLIAGVAIANGIDAIITKNAKHFERIKKLQVISY